MSLISTLLFMREDFTFNLLHAFPPALTCVCPCSDNISRYRLHFSANVNGVKRPFSYIRGLNAPLIVYVYLLTDFPDFHHHHSETSSLSVVVYCIFSCPLLTLMYFGKSTLHLFLLTSAMNKTALLFLQSHLRYIPTA